MALQFLVVAGLDQGRVFTLNAGRDLMLGRSAQAQYQLTDPRVSRNHCQVLLQGDDVVVMCNGGSGGTFINDKQVQRQAMKPGDVLKIGDTQLRLQIGDLSLDVARAQTVAPREEPLP